MDIRSVVALIGNTPVVELGVLPPEGGGRVFVKLEKQNPGGSVKDRAVLGMIRHSRDTGALAEGAPLVEATSGNTGIALALLGNLLGHPVTVVMPDSMSRERQEIIRGYGAGLVLTPGSLGMKGAIERAQALVAEDPEAVHLGQFENPGNVRIHEETTGPEILRNLPEVDLVVAGIGTGGTATGIARCLEKRGHKARVVGVEPAESPVLQGGEPAPHPIQGLGAGFLPPVLEMARLHQILGVPGAQALQTTAMLARREGLFLGISSGATVWAALQLARALPPDTRILAIAPDGGDKYLSSHVFGGEDDER